MSKLYDKVLRNIKTRRQNLINGGTNCIPSDFIRFRNDWPGIEHGRYIVVTASTKGAKTQFTNHEFVFVPLLYAMENPTKASVNIIYFPLEEQDVDMMHRFLCFMLYKKKGYIIDPSSLLSTSIPLPQEVINHLESNEFKVYANFYESHIRFEKTHSPRKIAQVIEDYCISHGTVTFGEEEIDEEGEITRTILDYKPNDPNEYFISIIDHISLIDDMKGKTKKASIDWLSTRFVKIRNDFNNIIVVVQQQSFENEKTDKTIRTPGEPTRAGAGDSKYTMRDANIVFGVYAPHHFKVPSYFSYDILQLKDRVRFLSVLANRNGMVGGCIGLRFIGECSFFTELPKPTDDIINKFYAGQDIQTGKNNIPGKDKVLMTDDSFNQQTKEPSLFDSLIGDGSSNTKNPMLNFFHILKRYVK